MTEVETSIEDNISWENPNLRRFDFELTEEIEQALDELGLWWEGRLLAKGSDIAELPCVQALNLKTGINRRYYTLLTHHTSSDTSKEGILKLGGVIYRPDSEKTLYYGEDAGRQLRASLGKEKTGQSPYGKVKDGKTFVYLHPLPDDLYDDAHVYLQGPNGMALAKAFSDNPPNFVRSRFKIEQVIQAPWEYLDTWLTKGDGLELLKKYLSNYASSIEADPEMVYRLRMIENRYLIAVV